MAEHAKGYQLDTHDHAEIVGGAFRCQGNAFAELGQYSEAVEKQNIALAFAQQAGHLNQEVIILGLRLWGAGLFREVPLSAIGR